MIRSLAIAALLVSGPAHAQSASDWFRSLMRPDAHTSCCDVSDCRATNARYVNGHWEAEYHGTMTTIPGEKVVRDQSSYDGRAYLCATNGATPQTTPYIFCFVKPGGQT